VVYVVGTTSNGFIRRLLSHGGITLGRVPFQELRISRYFIIYFDMKKAIIVALPRTSSIGTD
jgi:hypothetical protein